MKSYLLSDIVAQFGGQLHGPDLAVQHLAPLDRAQPGDITFLSNYKLCAQLEASAASAIIVSPELTAQLSATRSWIITADPYLYFAKVATLLYPVPPPAPGIHPTAVVGAQSVIAPSAQICEGVSIGQAVSIGERCRIYPGVVIGDGCKLGADIVLYPNITLYPHCQIGNRVIVHSGAIIGADGFGLAWDQDHWFKIPQTGRTILEDDVEIGANTTVDRGTLLDTVVHCGAKIDNLVHIAHNVSIGAHTAIAACVGIAGSAKIGACCTIGGAAMFVGHITVADQTHIGGGTLVSKSIKTPGTYASSYPLQTKKDWMNNAVHLRYLDDLVKRVKKLEQVLRNKGLSDE